MPGVQKNRADMITDIVTNIYNNIVKFIAGDNVQQRLLNLEVSVPNILSDKDAASGYVGLDANGQMLQSYVTQTVTKGFMDTLIAANQVVANKTYRITGAATTRALLVRGATINTLYPFATDTASGETGIYNITTDKFIPGTLVSFKKSLSNANLLAGGAYDISELPAPGVGYAWRVIEAEIDYTYNSIAFDNLTEFDVVVDGGRASHAANYADMSPVAGNIFQQMTAIDTLVTQVQIIENAKVRVEILGTPSTTGNGTAIIYGSAKLITL